MSAYGAAVQSAGSPRLRTRDRAAHVPAVEPERPLRVVAIDDEPLALLRIETVMKRVPGARLIATAGSGATGVELVRLLRPDVVLLDVEMDGVCGFELLAALGGDAPPAVIFVTAHDAFAARAFEVDAVDYLLKPMDQSRLAQALARARRHLARPQAEVATRSDHARDFWAIHRGGKVRVPIRTINWLESDRDYVRLHTTSGAFLIRGPLTTLMKRLDPAVFQRVRRSAIVRLDAVAMVRNLKPESLVVVLTSGEELRVGDTYRAAVQRLFRGAP